MNLTSYLKSYVHMNLKRIWKWIRVLQTPQIQQPCQCSQTLEEVSLGGIYSSQSWEPWTLHLEWEIFQMAEASYTTLDCFISIFL